MLTFSKTLVRKGSLIQARKHISIVGSSEPVKPEIEALAHYKVHLLLNHDAAFKKGYSNHVWEK